MLAAAHSSLTFFQSIVIGLIQGVTELFPISSLGHSVLLPKLFGWSNLVKEQSKSESFYLAFVVGLHCGSALALLFFYRRDWMRIIRGFLRTIAKRAVETSDERLAWLIVVATVPTAALGLVLEHPLRTLFAKPLAAAIFLTINGGILLAGERVRQRSAVRALAVKEGVEADGFRRLDTLEYKEAGIVGFFQSFALLAGISRSGITMVAGLIRGLDHEDAAKFAFLLATPIILGAGLYKLGDLFGPLGAPNHVSIRGQVLAGSVVAGLASYVSVRFLTRYFKSSTLAPFGVYCLVAGVFFILFSTL
ncbi:MAG TPA: undecaprenyl-diphosphate phosphatase [Acidimicrobiales bacterium]|nr:undecaprenyl-diphosphate phosphatase [Acidimicrobiales bacterium]